MTEETTARSRFNWSKFQITIALVVSVLVSSVIASGFTYAYQQRVEHRLCIQQRDANKNQNKGFKGISTLIKIVVVQANKRLEGQTPEQQHITRQGIQLYTDLLATLGQVHVPSCK